MDIIIRISPKLSATANDFETDKERLVKTCFKSLYLAGGDNNFYFILDNCSWSKYFKKYGEVFEVNLGNKRGTIELMYQIALKGNQDTILFLEDDYLWREGAKLENLEEACKHFGVVTPYDHPDHYNGINKSFLLEVFGNEIWRYSVTTTHTFAVRRNIFIDHFEDFNYGNHDWIMWTKLQIAGVHLWSPINSYATHLAKGHEALAYDWRKWYNKLT